MHSSKNPIARSCDGVVTAVSEHFTMADFTRSETATKRGIDNTPPIDIQRQLPFTMAGMERIQAFLGFFCRINSGFRCPDLNEAVGGSPNSQHLRGEACDFTCSNFGTPKGVAKELADAVRILGIDQLILEGTWIHVSFTLTPRYDILTKVDGAYVKGIV